MVALQLSQNGQLTGATYLGASGSYGDGGTISATGDGTIVITGVTNSLDFLGPAGQPDPQNPGFAMATNPDGSITPIQPPFPLLTLPIQVLFGGGAGELGEVLYAGAAPGLVSGVIQINARIPSDLGSIGISSNIDLVMGGQRFDQRASIWIE